MKTTSFDKDKIKFLLLEGVHESAIKTLNASGYYNIEHHKTALDANELQEKLADVQFVGIRSRTQLNAEALKCAKNLYAIGCFCIGTNQVDLEAAARQGVATFNAPYANTRSVAEMVLAEAILLLRHIPAKNTQAHLGNWHKSVQGSYETRGKKLGIIGYGNIGSQLSVLAENIGMDVYFYDTVSKLPMGNATQVFDLKQLLSSCDVISLHVPQSATTRNLLSAQRIDQIKKGAVVINASRGNVVDIDALSAALKDNRLSGAAIDVFPTEPRSNNEKFNSPLQGLGNVILTPHIGGSTMEAQENIGVEVADKLVRYSDTGTSLTVVNFPEVNLPSHADLHRILHIHENIPGVLSSINQVFSQENINISGQYLQTCNHTGYVVTDIEVGDNQQLLDNLASIPGTLRCRILY